MKSCPIFSNLKTLVLEGWRTVCEIDALIGFVKNNPILEKIDALICFIKHTPILEKIVLQLDVVHAFL